MQSASRRSRKKAANLSIDAQLLEEAKRFQLNPSQLFESSLQEAIRQKQQAEWLEQNR